MGFTDAKRRVIAALVSGNFQHQARRDIDVKNLLQSGEVGVETVAELLKNARGNQHARSPHHQIAGIDVHVVRIRGWYIKWYFLPVQAGEGHGDTVIFISVHPSEDEET
jgi:hypothetical protein